MRDHRIGLDLFNDVLDVLERHEFTRGDDQHAANVIMSSPRPGRPSPQETASGRNPVVGPPGRGAPCR